MKGLAKELEKYRTFVAALVGIGALTYCAAGGSVHGEDLQAVKWGIVGIVGLVAGRAVGTAAAGGGGWSGIKKVLATDAKPERAP